MANQEESHLRKQLEKELAELEAEIAEKHRLIKLLETFPDLKTESNRWGRIYYTSPSLNPLITSCEFRHGCGCCSDSPLYASPFVIVERVKLYTSPASINIGQSNEFGYGEVPDPGWEDRLRKLNIPDTIIEKVREYFLENPPISYDEEEEE